MGKNIVKRQIPFTPMMKRVLPYIDFEKARNVNLNSLNTAMKRIFPNHHLHELRYTFITRCKESGVHGEVVLLWDGHEEDKTIHSSKVDRGYTAFSKEFQLKEATKVNYLEWNFEKTEKQIVSVHSQKSSQIYSQKIIKLYSLQDSFQTKKRFLALYLLKPA